MLDFSAVPIRYHLDLAVRHARGSCAGEDSLDENRLQSVGGEVASALLGPLGDEQRATLAAFVEVLAEMFAAAEKSAGCEAKASFPDVGALARALAGALRQGEWDFLPRVEAFVRQHAACVGSVTMEVYYF